MTDNETLTVYDVLAAAVDQHAVTITVYVPAADVATTRERLAALAAEHLADLEHDVTAERTTT